MCIDRENKVSEKPKYLYHGSQYLFAELVPMQAHGENKQESLLAIYAAENIDEVIPFALPIRWYPDSPEGKRAFRCVDGKTYLEYGSLNPNGVGYVYKVKSDLFEKIDAWQYISNEKCIPVEVIKIKVIDYLDKVEFSEEAKVINEELYKYLNNVSSLKNRGM